MNSNSYNRILNVIKISICILLLFFIAYETDMNARMDDEYIGEQVYWLLKKGYVKSELMGGYNGIGLEKHQTVYHKLWVYNGYLFCLVGGWSLLSLHISSFAYLVLFTLFLWKYLKDNYKQDYGKIFSFCAIVFLSNHEIKNISWSFRPEIMVMCLGFISYFFLNKFLKNKGLLNLTFAGLFAGLAFLTHLNGLIYIIAGFGLLISQKKFKNAFLFGSISAFIFSFYFVDIFLNANPTIFFKQLHNDPSLKKGLWTFASILERFFMEQARYLFSIKEIPFSIFLIIIISFTFKYLKSNHKEILIYTFFLVATMSIWSYTKVPYLLILQLPFLCLIGSISSIYVFTHLKEFPKLIPILLTILIFAHIIIDLSFSSYKIYNNWNSWHSPSTRLQNSLIRKDIESYEKISNTKQIKVLAYGSFIFNEIENFKSIKNAMQYEFFIESHDKPRLHFTQVIDSVKKYNLDYIIFNEYFCKYFNLNNNSSRLYSDRIIFIKENNRIKIFKLKK